jgi:hypothetical protein
MVDLGNGIKDVVSGAGMDLDFGEKAVVIRGNCYK